jgi:hypothetical protein
MISVTLDWPRWGADRRSPDPSTGAPAPAQNKARKSNDFSEGRVAQSDCRTSIDSEVDSSRAKLLVAAALHGKAVGMSRPAILAERT